MTSRYLTQPANIIRSLSEHRTEVLRGMLLERDCLCCRVTLHSAMCRVTLKRGPCSCYPAVLTFGAEA